MFFGDWTLFFFAEKGGQINCEGEGGEGKEKFQKNGRVWGGIN